MFIDFKLTLFILFIFLPLPGKAQRVFVKNIDGVNRSYLYYQSQDISSAGSNKPLLIVLHKNGSDAREAYQHLTQGITSKDFIVLFANGFKNYWSCHPDSVLNDAAFLKTMIADAYDNFHINRNRVYLLHDSSNECTSAGFRREYPDSGIQNFALKNYDDKEFSRTVENIQFSRLHSANRFSLWDDPLINKKMNFIDSLKNYRLHNRWVIDYRIGGFTWLPSAKTGVVDETYMDLSKAHAYMGFTVTKWMNDSLAWFVDAGTLKVPKKKDMAGTRMKVGGGMIIPFTLGVKYAFFRRPFLTPYGLIGAGFTSVILAGARFNPANITPGQLPNLKSGSRIAFQMMLGSGFDIRLSKRIMVGGHARYVHSAKFKTLGEVHAVRGMDLSASIGFILNANSVKKLPVR